MATLNEGKIYSDIFLIEEEEFKYSRDQVTLITGQNLVAGTVVGIITASGKATILAPAAADGSQIAVGILAFDCNATAADQQAVIVAREAIVKSSAITWPGGITAPQKTTAIGQLKALGVLIRTDY